MIIVYIQYGPVLFPVRPQSSGQNLNKQRKIGKGSAKIGQDPGDDWPARHFECAQLYSCRTAARTAKPTKVTVHATAAGYYFNRAFSEVASCSISFLPAAILVSITCVVPPMFMSAILSSAEV